ncbi:hypothetical protein N7462_008332 [Penicillium macrosclerotiorum]|uniref:uncharacterized protein n=1 Tax=Penicillium macrosclerotiorum TaxID=303699 RepID=UPI002547B133|nr:uncharacterized protein N7462_008332 [Penicillium macrosclerotiorum]KAJ5675435.1 hypothetical protein N7462_008332 [Penicillium macrosclerotiorum]
MASLETLDIDPSGRGHRPLAYNPPTTATFKLNNFRALQAGYRLIETCKTSAAEELVGQAIRQSEIPRSEITVVTKLCAEDWHDVRGAFARSRRSLDTYIDIYVLQSPQGLSKESSRRLLPGESPNFTQVYKEMEKLVGPHCRGLGISHFSQKTLEVLLEQITIMPLINEIEINPLNPNLKLVPYCLEKGIRPVACRPLADSPTDRQAHSMLNDEIPLLNSLASAYNISASVIILSWLAQRDIVAMLDAGLPSQIDANLELVKLKTDEMNEINSLHQKIGLTRVTNPADALGLRIPGEAEAARGWTAQDMGWEDDQGRCLT